jgi:hypothetical protein
MQCDAAWSRQACVSRRSGGPHRIPADGLRPHPHVVLCVQIDPVVSPVTQGARRKVKKGFDSAGWPRRR